MPRAKPKANVKTEAQLRIEIKAEMEAEAKVKADLRAKMEAEAEVIEAALKAEDNAETSGIAVPQNRTSRSASSRETETRSRKPWQPPAMLEVPKPQAGMQFRWLRAEMMGEADKTNMSQRLREGYEVVNPAELEGYNHLPTIDDGKHAGVIGVGGLILGKIPVETANERRAYYSQQTKNQMGAIDNALMDSSQAVMPMGAPSRKRSVSFGNPDNKGTGDSEA